MAAPVVEARLHRMRFATVLLSFLGILVAFYAYYVKLAKQMNAEYSAICDLHEKISCTKVLGSRFAKGFGVFPETSVLNQPNSFYGIAFYVLLICLDVKLNVPLVKTQVALTVAANLMTVYLAYILAFILHDLCVVCVATYVINALLLVYNIKKLKLMQKSRPKAYADKKAK